MAVAREALRRDRGYKLSSPATFPAPRREPGAGRGAHLRDLHAGQRALRQAVESELFAAAGGAARGICHARRRGVRAGNGGAAEEGGGAAHLRHPGAGRKRKDHCMIAGRVVAIFPPMKSGVGQDGLLDFGAFKRLIDWHVEEGTDGIVVVGTTGESPTVNVDEHKELIRVAVQHSRGRIPIIAGTGGNSTVEAIELTESAKKAGATASLSVVPYYNKPTQEGMSRHFRKIGETVDLPMILYNVPTRTVADMQNDTVLRLSQVPGIIGIKDASANIERGTDLIRRMPRNFAIYSGEDVTSLALILLGGHGVISVTANVAPKLMHQMCAAALVGDVKKARDINLKLLMLHQRLFVETSPAPVKWAMAEMGLIENGLRLPLVPMSEKNQSAVREALHEAGIALPGLRVVEGRA